MGVPGVGMCLLFYQGLTTLTTRLDLDNPLSNQIQIKFYFVKKSNQIKFLVLLLFVLNCFQIVGFGFG